MKKLTNYMIVLMAIFGLLTINACSDDENNPDPSMEVSDAAIDFGDVQAGATATEEFTVTGQDISGALSLSVTGEGFSLSQSTFPVAGAANTVTVTFSPAEDAEPGAATGSVTIEGGGLSETVDLTANITERPAEELPAGTVIYSNDFEFDLGHQDPLTSEILDGTSTVHEEATVTHLIVDDEENGPYVKVQGQFAMCDDTASEGVASADNNDDSDGFCGNGITVQAVGNSVEFQINGLIPNTAYTAIYWIRPNAGTERGLEASLTGGPSVSHEFSEDNGNGDNTIYTEFRISGQSDAEGQLNFKLEATLPTDNNNRAMSIDNITIVAGNE